MALTVLITTADGTVHRCGADEPDAAWVPLGIQWESQVPGGWKTASFSLRRRIDEDIPLRLLDEVEIIDEHGEPVYEGRIQRLPRQHGDDFLLGVECLGWAAHLLDDTSFSQIYVDRDQTHWQDMSLQRRLALLNVSYKIGDRGLGADATSPSSALAAVRHGFLLDGGKPIVESFYDAGAGNLIAAVYYNFDTFAWGTANSDANWHAHVSLADNDQLAGAVASSNLVQSATAGAGYITPATPKRWVILQNYYDAALSSGPHLERAFNWYLTAVYGDHGLTRHLIDGAEPGGFYIDDMLAHALRRAAPKLNYSTGEGGSIQRPPIVVAQAAYREPGSLEPVVLDLNKYVLWEWGCGKGRTFFFRPPDPDRLTWEARLDRGVHLSLEGDDAEHAYNGAVVRYSLWGGTQRAAGPTGSGLDIESDLLGDTDPENTVNQHGYPRKWIDLEVQFPILDEYAVTIGSAYLAQAALPSRSGDITLKGEINHPTKGLRPVREIFAGDWIRLSHHPADVPRRIISARHNDDENTTIVTVGNEMNKVDAMLEQLGVVTRVRLGS